MPLNVTVDMYLGPPNPTWDLVDSESQAILSGLRENRVSIRGIDEVDAFQSYRGMVIEASGEIADEMRNEGLPTLFRFGGDGSERRSHEIESQILDFASRDFVFTESDEHVIASEEMREVTPAFLTSDTITLDTVSVMAACKYFRTSSTDYSFWNASNWIKKNNCYNYAANKRRGAIAVVGKKGKKPIKSASDIKIPNMKSGLASDGWNTSCGSTMSRVWCYIAAGRDYHFYRNTSSLSGKSVWSHKPGITRARNTDANGKRISSPSSAAKGIWKTYVGQYYAPGGSLAVK